MVRAATSGAFNFRQFDPRDRWQQQRLRLVLLDLERQQQQTLAATELQFWLSRQIIPNLTADGFQLATDNAHNALITHVCTIYPHLRDAFGESGLQTARDAAVSAYQQEIGTPGTPEYEAKIDEIDKILSRGPMSEAEKLRMRARRKRTQTG